MIPLDGDELEYDSFSFVNWNETVSVLALSDILK